MKNEKLYSKTISILVKAYLNDTLETGDCNKCAVGNLCSAAGFPPATMGDDISIRPTAASWAVVFRTYDVDEEQTIWMEEYKDIPKLVIKSTGYTLKQLQKIEFAFEKKGKDMFAGLMAVIDILGEIHEVEKETTEETKKLFVKI
jgi:hypothetical protein